MSIHRFRVVADFYTDEELDTKGAAEWLRTILTVRFPLGVIEGYPDVWDTWDKIEAIRRARMEEAQSAGA